MLVRPDGVLFAVGRARFADDLPGGEERTAKIYVKVEPQQLGHLIVAQLDTGSSWSVLDIEVAGEMNLLEGRGEVVPLNTRFGRLTGHLERTSITILADEGNSLDIDATVWVSREWPAGNFIGYAGLLERIRFGVDPAANFFYFGPISNSLTAKTPSNVVRYDRRGRERRGRSRSGAVEAVILSDPERACWANKP